MKVKTYLLIKEQDDEVQSILLDAMAYRSAYMKLPEGLKPQYVEILTKIDEMERTESEEQKVFSFDSPNPSEDNFREIFAEWLAYKKERHESYKSRRALKCCYTRLVKLSGGDAEIARKIIETSMANNYSGLFPYRKENHGTEERISGYASVAARLAQLDGRAG